MDHPRHPRPKYALRPSRLCAPPVELAGWLAKQFARLPQGSAAQPAPSHANAAGAKSGSPLRRGHRPRRLQPQPGKEIEIRMQLSSFLRYLKVRQTHFGAAGTKRKPELDSQDGRRAGWTLRGRVQPL